MDFLVWSQSASTTAIGSLNVVSLVTVSTGASVHVRPAGTPDVELEVSNGSSTGGGTVHRAAEGTHSSRELKSDIAYLGPQEESQAYEEVKALKHATFRYKRIKGKTLVEDSREPIRLGLIYEDAPSSIRGTGESIVIDERVNNAEMALAEFIRKLEKFQSEVSAVK